MMPMFQALAINLAAIMLAMLALWRASVAIKDVSFIDAVWAYGMVGLALLTALLMPGGPRGPLGWALLVLVLGWGLRLGTHLLLRWRRHGRDPRYERIIGGAMDKRGWSFAKASLLLVFALQGPLLWFVSMPAQVGLLADSGATIGPLGWLGIGVAIVGIGFESIGDRQLEAFRRNPHNKGKVLDIGLWRYTRVAPQPDIEHLALVVRVAAKGFELPVADAFKADPDNCHADSQPAERADGGAAIGEQPDLCRHADKPQQRPLQGENQQQRCLGKAPAALVHCAADDPFIARIPTMAAPAQQQVGAQPQTPAQHQHQQRPAQWPTRPAGHEKRRQQRQPDHAIGPDRIDEADILDRHRGAPQRQHRQHDRGKIDRQRLKHRHHAVSPSNLSLAGTKPRPSLAATISCIARCGYLGVTDR